MFSLHMIEGIDMKRSLLLSGTVIVAAALLMAAPHDGLRASPPSGVDESSLDARLFRFFNGSIVNPVFDWLMPFVTELKRWRVFLILVWCWLVLFGKTKGRWAALMLIPLIAASDQLSAGVIKPLTERLRPCEALGNVHFWHSAHGWIWTPSEAIGGFKTSYSFPSTHAANITSSMLFLSLVYRRWVYYICLPIAVLVSFSRIYNGVHWPSDVAVGIALGAALGVLAYAVFKRVYREKKVGDESAAASTGAQIRAAEPGPEGDS
jgi:undecaprenyl-diphosphatase